MQQRCIWPTKSEIFIVCTFSEKYNLQFIMYIYIIYIFKIYFIIFF